MNLFLSLQLHGENQHTWQFLYEYWLTYYKICKKLLICIFHDDKVAFCKYYFLTNLSVAKRWYQLSIAKNVVNQDVKGVYNGFKLCSHLKYFFYCDVTQNRHWQKNLPVGFNGLILINSLTVLKLSQNKEHTSDTRHIPIFCIPCLSVQLRMVEFDD